MVVNSNGDLRSRLEALNRARLEGQLQPARTIRRPDPSQDRPAMLRQVVPGRVVQTPTGSFYRITARASRQGPQGRDLIEQYRQNLVPPKPSVERRGDLARLAGARPTQALYIDLETCGFAGNPLFLIGLMYWSRNDLRIVQLLARNYAEEGPIIQQAAELLNKKTIIVSFNGKSFDWPMLRERAVAHRVRLTEQIHHCDLLHESRRAWPDLSDHRLTTLETVLCHRRRTGDIAGSQIPQAYHHFVRTGNARLIGSIIRHNLWDLMTLAELTMLALSHRPPKQ